MKKDYLKLLIIVVVLISVLSSCSIKAGAYVATEEATKDAFAITGNVTPTPIN